MWSPGSLTPEWGPNMWTQYFDLTYISANPIIGDFEYSPRARDFKYNTFRASDHFNEFIDAYNFAWDDRLHTVHPKKLTNVALQEAARDGQTRLVVHYMQPHLPFIGEDGFSNNTYEHRQSEIPRQSIDDRDQFFKERSQITLYEKLIYDVTWREELEYNLDVVDNSERGYEALLRADLVTKEEIKKGYKGNLELALGEIQRLINCVNCPVVLTSDHGEFLGEFGVFDHPPIYHPILRKVPWFEVSSSDIGTKENKHTPVIRTDSSITGDEIEERLNDLGYL